MKRKNKESDIWGHLFLGVGYDWKDWIVPICLRFSSMDKDFGIEIQALCFRAYLILCWG